MFDNALTADTLIAQFGPEAYDKACEMAIEALKTGNRSQCRVVSQAATELIRRGYGKKEGGEVASV